MFGWPFLEQSAVSLDCIRELHTLWLVVDVGRYFEPRLWKMAAFKHSRPKLSLRKETRLPVLLVFWEVCHHNDISRLCWIWPKGETVKTACLKTTVGRYFSTCKVGKELFKQHPVSWEYIPTQLIRGPFGQKTTHKKSKTLKLYILFDSTISPLKMYPTKIILSL